MSDLQGKRIVLGDWYEQGSVLRVDADGSIQVTAALHQRLEFIGKPPKIEIVP